MNKVRLKQAYKKLSSRQKKAFIGKIKEMLMGKPSLPREVLSVINKLNMQSPTLLQYSKEGMKINRMLDSMVGKAIDLLESVKSIGGRLSDPTIEQIVKAIYKNWERSSYTGYGKKLWELDWTDVDFAGVVFFVEQKSIPLVSKIVKTRAIGGDVQLPLYEKALQVLKDVLATLKSANKVFDVYKKLVVQSDLVKDVLHRYGNHYAFISSAKSLSQYLEKNIDTLLHRPAEAFDRDASVFFNV